MKYQLKNSGETIIEVLIAVSILMLISGPASALFVTNAQNMTANRNDLIAAALAEEGLEAVGKIRDTNLRRFSPKAVDCWNTKPEHADIAFCEQAGNKIADGSYRLALDLSTLKWKLEQAPIGASLNENLLGQSDGFYRLKLDETPEICPVGVQPNPSVCGQHQHFVDDTHLYNHARGVDTRFYRELAIQNSADAMEAVSRVVFRNGAKTRVIKRVSILTSPSL